jgi:hypothetical protein
MPETGKRESSSLVRVWKAAWTSAAFRIHVLITGLLLVVVLSLFSRFLEWVEVRPGVILQDPILAAVAPLDFTWPIFLLIYAGIVFGIVTLSEHPPQLIMAMQSYTLMVCCRFAVMYVVPLDPPAGSIPLADPFVQAFGSGRVLTRDLFFSGHTSTLLLLSFTAMDRRLKAFFALCAIVVGVLIVWQHVHYTVDVLVAPFVAYASYRIVKLFHGRIIQSGGNR